MRHYYNERCAFSIVYSTSYGSYTGYTQAWGSDKNAKKKNNNSHNVSGTKFSEYNICILQFWEHCPRFYWFFFSSIIRRCFIVVWCVRSIPFSPDIVLSTFYSSVAPIGCVILNDFIYLFYFIYGIWCVGALLRHVKCVIVISSLYMIVGAVDCYVKCEKWITLYFPCHRLSFFLFFLPFFLLLLFSAIYLFSQRTALKKHQAIYEKLHTLLIR